MSDRVSSTNTQGDSVNRDASRAGMSAAERREWADMNASNGRVAAGQGTAQDGPAPQAGN